MAYLHCKICGSTIHLILSGSSKYAIGPFGQHILLEEGDPVRVQCRTCTLIFAYRRSDIVFEFTSEYTDFDEKDGKS